MKSQLVDTHCHIHTAQYGVADDDPTVAKWIKGGRPAPDDMIAGAKAAGVGKLICVGTDLPDSELAVAFVQKREGVWVSIGLHPHEAKRYAGDPAALQQFAGLAAQPKVVAVGECGLDFYYNHSPAEDQQNILRFQIELALQHHLPLIFHVRDAFDQFWSVFDSYKGITGVIHSFSANQKVLGQILERGLYVGLNGIMTFTKDPEQLAAAKAVPLDRLVLETDAPYLTPAPYRGKICEPKFVGATAGFLAGLRQENVENLAAASTNNAIALFNL